VRSSPARAELRDEFVFAEICGAGFALVALAAFVAFRSVRPVRPLVTASPRSFRFGDCSVAKLEDGAEHLAPGGWLFERAEDHLAVGDVRVHGVLPGGDRGPEERLTL
jgi:hypothetical protein